MIPMPLLPMPLSLKKDNPYKVVSKNKDEVEKHILFSLFL